MHEVVNLILAEGNKGVSTLKACKRVAELVQAEVSGAVCAEATANAGGLSRQTPLRRTGLGRTLLPCFYVCVCVCV